MNKSNQEYPKNEKSSSGYKTAYVLRFFLETKLYLNHTMVFKIIQICLHLNEPSHYLKRTSYSSTHFLKQQHPH